MEEMRGASVAGSSFLGRERTAVDVDVCPERRSPRYHETCLALERERWVLFKIPRCDIDGAGEGKGPSLQGYTDRVLKKAPRPSTSYHLVEKEYKCNAYTVYTPRMHVRKIPNNHQTLSPTALSSPCVRQVMSSVNDSNARRKTSLRHASTTIVSDPGPGAFSFTAS